MLVGQHPTITLDLAATVVAERRRAERARDQRTVSRLSARRAR